MGCYLACRRASGSLEALILLVDGLRADLEVGADVLSRLQSGFGQILKFRWFADEVLILRTDGVRADFGVLLLLADGIRAVLGIIPGEFKLANVLRADLGVQVIADEVLSRLQTGFGQILNLSPVNVFCLQTGFEQISQFMLSPMGIILLADGLRAVREALIFPADGL